MSSFKKLRLDPETPIQGTSRNLLNQPGANDGRTSYLDSSSFSSSTSGGSGTYMRSAGPFRTRYSTPVRIPSPNTSSFSRFAPYYFGKERRSTLKVPLIRARRDESESDSYRPSSRSSLNSSLGGDSTASATTSTAQRIIETLQNLSTPVMNAGKIRIDQDIKAVQPLPFGSGSSFSRYSPGSSMNRSTGPPKMCSSLLMSTPSAGNQISPVQNLGDHRRLFCIPRMVDAATNTEKEIEVTSPSQIHKSNRVDFKTSVPSTSTASRQTSTGPASKSVATSKDDDSDEEYHECSSHFTFSSAWAPQTFDPYFSSKKNDKSVEKGNLRTEQQQPNLLNGYKEPPAPGFFSSTSASSNLLPKPSGGLSSSSGFGEGSAPQFSFGASPLKSTSVQAKPSGSLESSSSGPKPTPESALPSSGSASFKFGKTETSAPTKSTFSFGKDSAKDDKPTTTALDKVDAATKDNLTTSKSPFSSSSANATTTTKAVLPPLTAKTSGSKWRCSTCMVENELSAQACVCCSEKNPNQTQFKPPAVSVSANKKWRCPTCMVDNEFGTAACVCCSEKNPNPVSAPAPAVKKWRCPTCMVENDPAVPACVCCSEKNPSYSGDKKEEGVSSSSAPTSAFKFGAPSAAGAAAPASGNSTFSFGQPISAQKPPSTPFSFGAPPASAVSSAPSVPPSAPSVVSTTSSTVPSTPQAATSTPSLPLNTQPINTNSPFKFGSTTSGINLPPTTSFGFSSTLSTSSQPVTTTNTSTNSTSVFGSSKPIGETANNISLSAVSSGFGSSSFQSVASPSFNFGGASKTTADPPKAAPFAFGAASASKPAFGTFPFAASPAQSPAQPTSILSSTPQVSTSTPAPGIGAAPNFSFGSNSASSPFGQIQSPPSNPTPQPSSVGSFQFGGAATPMTPNRMNAVPPPAPSPSFSFTPNLNFGQAPGSTIPFGNPTQPTPNAGSQPPPPLFQFAATPSDSPGSARQIKKAVRRFKK